VRACVCVRARAQIHVRSQKKRSGRGADLQI
jgi:hypothetical protein